MSDTNLKPALFQPQVQSTASHLSAMKAVLIEKLWLGLFFLGLLGAPASMMRIATTGWQRAYGLHLGVAVIILLLYIFGKNLPNAVKAWTIMTVLVTVALTGLLNFGLVSQSGGILIVFMILSGLLFRRRTAILISSAFMAAIIVIGTGFVSNRLNVPFDANTYMHSVSGWIFLFLGATLFGGFVAIAVLVQREYIKKLLEENELQQQQILHQSNHDALTDLPTLRLAMDRLQMALNATGRSGQKVALMFVDLDNFKNINDSFGHAAGDHLLQQVAQRMKKVVRPCDTVARVGGDEFLVILEQQTDLVYAADIAKRLITALTRSFDYDGNALQVGCSVGISFAPDHASDPDGLKRAADAAMYEVKKAGKNSFVFATRHQANAPLSC